MAGSTAVICCTVRDCGDAMRRNIPRIERLRSKFKHSRVVIVENDSIDNTKEVLRDWAKRSAGITIISSDFQENPLVANQPQQSRRKFFARHRISLMAKYRNKYLDQVRQWALAPDFMIILDPDVHFFDIEGIANSFGQPSSWDAISSNGKGIEYAWGGMYRHHVFYDAYALRKLEEEGPQTIEMIQQIQYDYSDLEAGMPMLRVLSGFNGLAIYRMEAIGDARYFCEDNEDEEVEVLCEHVSLHRQMAENGYYRIFINPSQLVVYETLLQSYMNTFRRKIKKAFSWFESRKVGFERQVVLHKADRT